MAVKALARLFGARGEREAMRPLYDALIAEARQPHWYLAGGVADDREGRFEMIAAVLSLALIRLEGFGESGKSSSTHLAELFVDDMDGQLRESGVGDIVVGKHVGRMMGALGGRLGAYREGLAGGDLPDALRRNLYRGEAVGDQALAHSVEGLTTLAARLEKLSLGDLTAGQIA